MLTVTTPAYKLSKSELTDNIKKLCLNEGFYKVGIAPARILDEESKALEVWLNENRHADMHWIERNTEKRKNPGLILENVKSIISLAYLYDFPHPHNEAEPKIARYAWGSRDYHKVLKGKLKKICNEIEALGIKTRYYVDDGPVMEKVWAVEAGIGWMAKNTNVIIPEAGSFFFLSEILLNTELEYDAKIEDMCGSCRLCLDACPTGALYDEYKLDARLCISYQTIENRGQIPDEINTDGWIFGCDVCQDVCPYNAKGVFTHDNIFYPREEVINKTYYDYEKMDKEEFEKLFEGTPVRRTKYEGFIRNVRKAGK